MVKIIQYALTRYHKRLEEMASTDKLTGLLNRHAFFILIDKILANFNRAPSPISILLMDLDYLKSINDKYGHKAGDDALSSVAQKLKVGLRASDVAVRWGGDEFLLVLRGCGLSEAQRISENLRNAVMESPVLVNGKSLPITISVGLCEFNGNETPDEMIERADSALYLAKQNGRNRTEVAY